MLAPLKINNLSLPENQAIAKKKYFVNNNVKKKFDSDSESDTDSKFSVHYFSSDHEALEEILYQQTPLPAAVDEFTIGDFHLIEFMGEEIEIDPKHYIGEVIELINAEHYYCKI